MWPLIIAGLGLGYAATKSNSAVTPKSPTSKPSNYQPAQPSQMYPFRPIVAPRVDNANQPWYNGSKAAMVVPNDSNALKSGAATLQAGGSVVHSLSDVWGNLNNWFGGNTPKSNLNASQDEGTDATDENYDSDEYDVIGPEEQANVDWEQSNIVGAASESDYNFTGSNIYDSETEPDIGGYGYTGEYY